MDVYEIRRRNLDVLKAEAESFVAIAEAMRRAKQDVDPAAAEKDYANVLSQIKGGKQMGSQFARDIEVAMEKPFGWMDWPQFEAAYEARSDHRDDEPGRPRALDAYTSRMARHETPGPRRSVQPDPEGRPWG